jgi:hypothetical protein
MFKTMHMHMDMLARAAWLDCEYSFWAGPGHAALAANIGSANCESQAHWPCFDN